MSEQVYEHIIHCDADSSGRRLLLMDETRGVRLVNWKSNESLELPRFVVPDEFHLPTQGRTSYGAANVLDLRLGANHAALLTTEGFWTCALEPNAEWLRVAGHPNDPPEDLTLTNKSTSAFRGPIGLGQDGRSLRRGMSRPLKLSADGTTVIGAPNTRDILGSPRDYDIELKTVSIHSPQPAARPVKLRSGLEALALSADGSTVAFSEGRDFRVVRDGQTRASQYVHNKMFVRDLSLSSDGKFAASSGLYPTDLSSAPTRTVIWDVATRKVLDVISRSRTLGFVGTGDQTLLAVAILDHESPGRLELHIPGKGPIRTIFTGDFIQSVRGDSTFLAVLTTTNTLTIHHLSV